MVVVSGTSAGQNRVSSATITLNGVEVAGESSFNQNVPRFERSVSLGASNRLSVQLASPPESFLIISILGAAVDNAIMNGEPRGV